MELTELHLHGRLCTWSNEQTHQTLARIDHGFACLAWCDLFPHHRLHASSSTCSDHAPLMLHTNIAAAAKSRFKFESVWTKFLMVLDAVTEGWSCELHNADAFHTLDHKLCTTAMTLKKWSQKYVGSIRL
jgi:hypothetical protein